MTLHHPDGFTRPWNPVFILLFLLRIHTKENVFQLLKKAKGRMLIWDQFAGYKLRGNLWQGLTTGRFLSNASVLPLC
jgi:hypothetical protein